VAAVADSDQVDGVRSGRVPYQRCPNCGLTAYSPPAHAAPTTCSECCATLHADARLFHDVAAECPESLRRRLSPDVTAPANARRAVREMHAAIGDAQLPDVELMVSELVTNAIEHGTPGGHSPLLLEVDAGPRGTRVRVTDEGDGFHPHISEPGSGSYRGRGLLIVDQLSDRWGVSNGSATTVWFELDAGPAVVAQRA
jgi:anti-sigma regulatory factor (Ser/Thr protein kinase)